MKIRHPELHQMVITTKICAVSKHMPMYAIIIMTWQSAVNRETAVRQGELVEQTSLFILRLQKTLNMHN